MKIQTLDFFLIINAINIVVKIIIMVVSFNMLNGQNSFFKRIVLHFLVPLTVYILYCLNNLYSTYNLLKADPYLCILLCLILTALNIPIGKFFKKNYQKNF